MAWALSADETILCSTSLREAGRGGSLIPVADRLQPTSDGQLTTYIFQCFCCSDPNLDGFDPGFRQKLWKPVRTSATSRSPLVPALTLERNLSHSSHLEQSGASHSAFLPPLTDRHWQPVDPNLFCKFFNFSEALTWREV